MARKVALGTKFGQPNVAEGASQTTSMTYLSLRAHARVQHSLAQHRDLHLVLKTVAEPTPRRLQHVVAVLHMCAQ
eukprot:4632429-Alexandrium_andersonii.AAC.1